MPTQPTLVPTSVQPARKADLIEGFITGLAAILAFSDTTPHMTPSTLAAALGISRAAARRYLISLAHAGYAGSDGKQYWLTPRVLALGRSYMGSARLPRTTRPYLQRITASVQESSNLALLDGHEVVYAASANVSRLISTAIEPGTRLPAHATAAGRVILAGLPTAAFDAWLGDAELTGFTPLTITSKRNFAAEVASAGSSGFSAVESQFEVGLRGIAVPLYARDGCITAALGISMSTSSSSIREATRRCVPVLQAAAKELRDLL